MNIKAIETYYQGIWFRSRLEARWAVFFTRMGVKWEYEREGYQFDNYCYLPDFWIPEMKAYCEVKPAATQETPDGVRAQMFQSLLYAGTPSVPVYIIWGSLGPDDHRIQQPHEDYEGVGDMRFAECRRCGGLSYHHINDSGWGMWTCGVECPGERVAFGSVDDSWDNLKISKAYIAARSERFGSPKKRHPGEALFDPCSS